MSYSKNQTERRLVDVKVGANYLGVSEWTVRDYITTGVLPCVRLPRVRVNMGRVKDSKSDRRYRRELVAPTDARVSGQKLGKILLDVADLDALIEASKTRSEA